MELFVFPVSSTGYLVLVTFLDFGGKFIRHPGSCRVGRGIGLEDAPKLCDTLCSRCGLIVEAIEGSNWWQLRQNTVWIVCRKLLPWIFNVR